MGVCARDFSASGGQKKELDLLEMELQVLVNPQSECWELNSASQHEKYMWLTFAQASLF